MLKRNLLMTVATVAILGIAGAKATLAADAISSTGPDVVATSLNTGGSTTTSVGNVSAATSITGSTVGIAGNTSVTGTLDASGALSGGTVTADNGLTVTAGGATITGDSTVTGALDVSGALSGGSVTADSGLTVTAGGATITGDSTLTGAMDVSGALSGGSVTADNGLTVTAGGATITGDSTITGDLDVNGAIDSNGLDNAGTLTQVGTTSINTTGSAVTNIGNASSTTSITGPANINSSGTATTSIGTAGGATNIGNASSTNTVLGTTNVTGVTTINGSGTASTSIGNSNASSTTTITGGNSVMSVANGTSSLHSGTNGFTTYSSAKVVGTDITLINGDAASRALVTGESVTNYLSGNTLVDGNMYINGKLVYSSNSSATTTVTDSVTGAFGGTNVVNAGQTGYVVDANGKITSGTTTQSTAAMTVTNAAGDTHGLVVGENSTSLSGGAHSSSMVLNDNGATFSNTANGDPIKVTGVADGSSDFDAVNYRQLQNVAAGVAGVSAMANLPQIEQGKSFNVGMGFGNFQDQSAFAFGASARLSEGVVAKASASTSLNKFQSKRTVVGVGVGYSW